MKMRIAILAACAGTLALAQADVARADFDAASESKSLLRITDVGPEPAIRIAQSTGGGTVDIGAFETQRQKGKTAGPGKAKANIGNQTGFKIGENESPRPQDRLQQKAGGGAGAKSRGVAVGDFNGDGKADAVKRPGKPGQKNSIYVGSANGGVWK